MYLVAWSTPRGIVAQRLSPTGALVDGSPFDVMVSALGPAAVAALSHDFLVTGRTVGYSIQYVFPAAARVSGSGAVLDATPLLLGHPFIRQAPAVVALSGRWLVAWIRNASHNDPFALTMGSFIPPAGSPTPAFQIHGPFSTSGGNHL